MLTVNSRNGEVNASQGKEPTKYNGTFSLQIQIKERKKQTEFNRIPNTLQNQLHCDV